MKLLASQIDQASLAHLGEEVVSLLQQRDFLALADRFGYALAFGKPPATAIADDLQRSMAERQALPTEQNVVAPSIGVKYFQPNETGLFALVECVFDAAPGCPLLAELIVTSNGKDQYVTLEEVSSAAG
jgi:hypothetical protein